jgi:hypothetical protein
MARHRHPLLRYSGVGVENDAGSVWIYSGDRLDVSGVDTNGNAFYQTGNDAQTDLTELNDHTGKEFVGTLQTASKYGASHNSGSYGNIEIAEGKLILETFNPSATNPPAYASIVMGPLGNYTISGSAGTLKIDSAAILYVTANAEGNTYSEVSVIGNVTFNAGSDYETDAWAGASPVMCSLDLVDAAGSSANYDLSVSNSSTTCTLIDQNMTAWTANTWSWVLYNATGGSTGSTFFATNKDNAGTPHTFTASWSGATLRETA